MRGRGPLPPQWPIIRLMAGAMRGRSHGLQPG